MFIKNTQNSVNTIMSAINDLNNNSENGFDEVKGIKMNGKPHKIQVDDEAERFLI